FSERKRKYKQGIKHPHTIRFFLPARRWPPPPRHTCCDGATNSTAPFFGLGFLTFFALAPWSCPSWASASSGSNVTARARLNATRTLRIMVNLLERGLVFCGLDDRGFLHHHLDLNLAGTLEGERHQEAVVGAQLFLHAGEQ